MRINCNNDIVKQYRYMLLLPYNHSESFGFYVFVPPNPCDLRRRIIPQPQKNVKTREENYKDSHKSRREGVMRISTSIS